MSESDKSLPSIESRDLSDSLASWRLADRNELFQERGPD